MQYNYTNGSSYIVKLTVTDGVGLSSTCTKSITATTPPTPSSSNKPPISAFGYWTTGKTINFWFSGYDMDGTIVAYQWNFGDGQTSNVK